MNYLDPRYTATTTTILYVDDEVMAQKYFALTFGREYEVLTAPDADTAIAILRDMKSKIGIVVTDYRMPGRNGADLLRQLAREFPYVIRMLVTAYADREVLLDTINSGEVFRIIEKPLDMGEVEKALRLAYGLLRERNARQQKLMAINETLSFLAHELNTPLAAIINFAQGVRNRVADGSASPEQQAEISKAALAMDDNARYCLALLASHVESVRVTGALSAAHVGSTARQMIASLLDTYPLSANQRSFIQVAVHEDFPISALPNCVALVLSSLLSNSLRALKDTRAPKLNISVTAGDHPQICVTDNGPGIPPQIQDRLLVDPITTHADTGGSGWGLIFSKRIMQSFGGDIAISSLPNKHTTVTLNFPAVKARELTT